MWHILIIVTFLLQGEPFDLQMKSTQSWETEDLCRLVIPLSIPDVEEQIKINVKRGLVLDKIEKYDCVLETEG